MSVHLNCLLTRGWSFMRIWSAQNLDSGGRIPSPLSCLRAAGKRCRPRTQNRRRKRSVSIKSAPRPRGFHPSGLPARMVQSNDSTNRQRGRLWVFEGANIAPPQLATNAPHPLLERPTGTGHATATSARPDKTPVNHTLGLKWVTSCTWRIAHVIVYTTRRIGP